MIEASATGERVTDAPTSTPLPHPDTYAMDASVPALVIDQETLDHLPAFHKAIAEVLIEKGRWQLVETTR